MVDAHIKQLLEKYLDDTLTGEERLELLGITQGIDNASLAKLLEEMLADQRPEHPWLDEDRLRRSLAKVLSADSPGVQKPRIRRIGLPARTWLRYAAAVILVAAVGSYSWLRKTEKRQVARVNTIAPPPVNDIVPGGDKAVLTLADGSAIVLDSAANGQLTTQQGSRILKQDGQLVYTPAAKEQRALTYNTLRTPRGGTYQLGLPDGTRVWLNAASSIIYPVAFTGKERVVEITGEAYFEVAPHPQCPFKVRLDERNTVEVLGTKFDVKAYAEDKSISTTLLQGAVRVTGSGQQIILKPGEQAEASGQQLSVKTLGQIGLSEAVAWKEGLFNFQDASLQEIMRQLARWYDIEVIYENGIPNKEFIGEVQRSLPLSEVLKGLRMSGVHFRLTEGRRLIVSP